MNPVKLIAASSVVAILAACAIGAGSVSDAEIGLSKTSVFNTPDPEVFVYDDTRARYSKAMARAFPGAPPQVPHEVASMLPITLEDNQCLECHDRPDEIDAEEAVKGGNPMNKAHYSKVGAMGSDEGWNLSGARFTCNQCHVPQAGVAPLVENTFAE
ncbi:MAG: Nitrate reductase cytochrome c550-type subunit [Olavius algarvensis Gamma 3 endosymbiont]|nr:MAG: Nitrate reductase cytochrome c550-type subunit [Olavius algarvensis Gamma 3 endosymbiont]